MVRGQYICFVIVSVMLASGRAAIAQPAKPIDAKSYCEKVRTLPGLPEYAMNVIEAARATAAIAKDNREKVKQFNTLFAQGADDPQGTLAKKVLERVNAAVPKKDSYNQDQAVGNYINWFAACAAELRSDKGLSPASVVFLSPLGPDASKFYSAAPDARASILLELMGPPGLGGLQSRDIEARTGVPFSGINPRWVLPIAIAMDGADALLTPYLKQASTAALAFADASKVAAQEKQNIATGNNSVCQRIETSDVVKKLVDAIKRAQEAKVDSDQMKDLVNLRFDNSKGELSALVKKRALDATGQLRPDINQQSQLLRQYNTVIEACAQKNIDSDLFLLFASDATTVDRVAAQREQTKRGSGTLLNYDGKKPNTIDTINPMWASLYAFLFDDGEQISTRYGLANIDAIAALTDATVARRKEQAATAELESYKGLRTLYAFSQSPPIAPSYQKCVTGETVWQSKIADQLEAAAKNANTVAEEKNYTDASSFRRKYLATFASAMCLYRLNFGIVMLDTDNTGIAIMLAADTKDLRRENPAEKYTANAIPRLVQYLVMTPVEFHEGTVGKYLQSAKDQLDQTQTYTRRQAERLQAGKTIVGLANAAAEEAIMASLIEPMLNSKHLN